jgi:hypothetical protein
LFYLEPYFEKLNGAHSHGDQIGRIFDFWAIVFFRQFHSKYERSPNFRATIITVKVKILVLTKNGLGHILGEFFTNSFGHLAHSLPDVDRVTR